MVIKRGGKWEGEWVWERGNVKGKTGIGKGKEERGGSDAEWETENGESGKEGRSPASSFLQDS